MPPVADKPINGAPKANPTLLDRLVQFLVDSKLAERPKAKHDEFVPHDDAAEKKDNENAEALRDSGSIKGLLSAAQGVLKNIGSLMGQNITSNPIANFAKNDTVVGLGNQAKEYIERALVFEAIKKLPGLSGLATTLNTIAASIVGFAKGFVSHWLEAIKSDFASNKNVQKLSDR